MEQVTILGSTGSIGASTLDVMARHPDSFQVFALSGNSRIELLVEQCCTYNPKYVVVSTDQAVHYLRGKISPRIQILQGVEGLVTVAEHGGADTVMAAIVGAAGLLPTLAAARAGKKILLANKESLVMAGDLFIAAVREGGATLLPVDSEHNAIFQCLPLRYQSPQAAGINKVLLSASGGPFRTLPLEEMAAVTPEQACAHPNWSMGRKISVDSATMMNKGLELIEACWLFDLAASDIEVVIHPQSLVHSLVQYRDGSVLAQMGYPDMRTPIAHALAWPRRIDAGVERLDLAALGRLEFEAPDLRRFPCLGLAMQVSEAGADLPAALNAANEVAVAAFLEGRIAFTAIAEVVDAVLQDWGATEPESLEVVQHSDQRARERAIEQVNRLCSMQKQMTQRQEIQTCS